MLVKLTVGKKSIIGSVTKLRMIARQYDRQGWTMEIFKRQVSKRKGI